MFKKKNKSIALISFACAYIIWGINTPFIKIAAEEIHPTIYLFIRYFVPLIVLVPFAVKSWKPLKKGVWLRLIISSVIGFALSMYLITEGLKRTSALDASIIYLLGPVLIFILSVELLKEKFNAKILLGLLVALCGTALVVLDPLIRGEQSNGSDLVGNLMIVGSVIAMSLGTTIVKPALKKVRPLQATTIRFAASLIFIAPFAFTKLPSLEATSWSWQLIAVLTFSCVMGSVVSFMLYHYGLGKISGEESSTLHYLDPIFGVIASILVLGDQPTTVVIIGGGLALWGVILSETKTKHRLHFFHAHK